MKPTILVKLKMRPVYKTFLFLVAFLIIMVSSIGVIYLFYDHIENIDGDIEVNGALSINYVDGKNFDINDNKIIKFSVSNASDGVRYYNLAFRQIRGFGHYKLYYNDTLVLEGDLRTIDEITTEFISIDSKETKTYTLEIENSGDQTLKGKLDVRVQTGKIVTFADTILKNSNPTDSTLSKVGDELAVEDEGLIKSSDDIGVSYYFRGDVKNNYVSFANRLWRIVRINGDGTVRIILDDTSDTLVSYYSAESLNEDFKTLNINTYLDNWFTENLLNYKDYIANSRFCHDIGHDDNYNFNSYIRIMTNKIPTLNCLGSTINNNIGLLTIDEAILAGAGPQGNNKNYYLYNSDITESWYTMSAAKGTDTSLNLFMIDSNGSVRTDIVGNLYREMRPVINLIKNIEIDGSGTLDDPYKIIE